MKRNEKSEKKLSQRWRERGKRWNLWKLFLNFIFIRILDLIMCCLCILCFYLQLCLLSLYMLSNILDCWAALWQYVLRLLLLYASDKRPKQECQHVQIQTATYTHACLPRWFDCHWYLENVVFLLLYCICRCAQHFYEMIKFSKQIKKRLCSNRKDLRKTEQKTMLLSCQWVVLG